MRPTFTPTLLRVARLARAVRPLLLLSLAACGEGPDTWDSPEHDASQEPGASLDAGSPADLSTSPQSGSTAAIDSGSRTFSADDTGAPDNATLSPDARADSARDASAPPNASASTGPDIGDILDGLLGTSDAGSAAPRGDASSSGWTLDPESDPSCPPEPPPLPIIGGPCLGIYHICSWRDATGTPYTCTCDWVHWLCI